MRVKKRRKGPQDLISAAEIGCFAFCPKQYRLQYGQRLKPGNRQALTAGVRHHAVKAIAEQLAGGSIRLGRVLALLALLAMVWWLWGRV